MNEKMQIPAFAEPITDLGDQPNLPSAELKRRFQAPADELREAHNALAGVVHGITSATYPDTVTEEMLAAGVREKIEGKAEESTVAARFTAETEAREALAKTVAENTRAVGQFGKVQMGGYHGSGSDQKTITFRFAPRLVFVFELKSHVLYVATSFSYASEEMKLSHITLQAPNAIGFDYVWIAFE